MKSSQVYPWHFALNAAFLKKGSWIPEISDNSFQVWVFSSFSTYRLTVNPGPCQASDAKVLSLFDLHMQDQRMKFPDSIMSDVGLSFADTDPCSSDSELGDLIGSASDDSDEG